MSCVNKNREYIFFKSNLLLFIIRCVNTPVIPKYQIDISIRIGKYVVSRDMNV